MGWSKNIMDRCPDCGASLGNSATTCPSCGIAIGARPAPDSDAVGEHGVMEGIPPAVGAGFPAANPSEVDPARPSTVVPAGVRWPMYVAILLMVVLLAGLLYWAASRG